VPEEVCAFVHKLLPIPVYGIGAGAKCDGQVLLACDALGMYQNFTPRFVKKYADIASAATSGMKEYIAEVKAGSFPAAEHKYKITGDAADFEALFVKLEEEFQE
jgi:3-methyl-2-oxobutanoate hydroxymethyltransferase